MDKVGSAGCEEEVDFFFVIFATNFEATDMFTVIGVMLGGIAVGSLLRRQEFSWIGKVITCLIWVLLFLLGVEVGGNRRLVEGLPTLGGEAFIVALACVLGSCVLAWALWHWLYKRKGGNT